MAQWVTLGRLIAPIVASLFAHAACAGIAWLVFVNHKTSYQYPSSACLEMPPTDVDTMDADVPSHNTTEGSHGPALSVETKPLAHIGETPTRAFDRMAYIPTSNGKLPGFFSADRPNWEPAILDYSSLEIFLEAVKEVNKNKGSKDIAWRTDVADWLIETKLLAKYAAYSSMN